MDLTFGAKTRTRIGCWNVKTMSEASKLAQVEREMIRYNIVLGLSEIRWVNHGEFRTANGNILIFSGRSGENRQRSEGVGFLLSKRAAKCLVEWKPLSERILTLRLYSRVRRLTFM